MAWHLVPTGGTHETSREWLFRRKMHKTPGYPGVLIKADEGIRTLDLRHGKATL